VDADMLMYDSAREVVTAQGNVRITFRRYRVFADAARYELRTQVLEAMGRVRVVDDQQRELRGSRVIYHADTEQGTLEAARGLVDRQRRVYFEADRLDFSPDRFVTHNSTITNCDPANPLLYLRAQRVEIVPEESAIAFGASAFVGARRIYTAPRLVVDLRPGQEGVLFPGFGAGEVDGIWVSYPFRVAVAGVPGRLDLKYGTRSGLFGLLTLTRRQPVRDPAFVATLRAGRAQTQDDRAAFNLLAYDVADLRFAVPTRRVADTTLAWSAEVTAGWYGERLTADQLATLLRPANVVTSRLDGRIMLETQQIPLAPRLTYRVFAGARASIYGTGDSRTIPSFGADLTYALEPRTTAVLGYQHAAISGATPLALDAVDPENTLSLTFTRAVPDRYRLVAGISHNAALSVTKYRGAVAVLVTPSLELGVFAVYNSAIAAFDDLDYTVRVVCDCADIFLRYRSVQRTVSIEFGLIGFGERRAQEVPRTQPPFVFPEDR
jgi:hypothetical protein